MQSHVKTLKATVQALSEESYCQLTYRDTRYKEALPSAETLKKIVELCRAVFFPGYLSHTRIDRQMIYYHMGVNVETLYHLLSGQIYAALCFADKAPPCYDAEQAARKAKSLSESFIASLPATGGLVNTDVEAIYGNDPAAPNHSEVIFCYPGVKAMTSYRIAHELFCLDVPFLPRMISEMAHSETGIDIHPGATIGRYFSIDHGTGVVIGETSVIGNHVRFFQGVSLTGGEPRLDANGNLIRGIPRHPVVGDRVTIHSNATLTGRIHIGEGATICGNVWITRDVAPGETISQQTIDH
ncbi:MAG: serine acetyltransferase [Tannerellaceae bacterium]|jgi:serine O-acetyltransferase|nr:serine acetyltransferase [Tannerellaceae bacterium]